MTVPHVRNSDTSRAAAEAIAPTVATLQMVVYGAIVRAGTHGRTCFEVEADHGMRHQTASARIWELHRGGHVRDSGLRRFAPSGRRAVVWVATRVAEAAE